MSGINLLFRWFLFLLVALPAVAQQQGSTAAPREVAGDSSTGTAPEIVTAATPGNDQGSSAPALRVTRTLSQNSKVPNRAALGDEVTVEVQGLTKLLSPGSQVRCSDLILFLDGIAIQGNPPESCSPGDGRVRFLLDRKGESDHAWRVLLAEPAGSTRTISVSIGSDAELAYPTDVRNFELEVLPRTELLCYFGILAIAIALFVRLVRKTSILRERGPMPEGQLAPFSLSLFQLAFWSILVIASYIFIWMVTEELDTITGSVLVLLSIGSGTALGAVLIDSGKVASTGAVPLGADTAAPAMLRSSKGFLNDLLSDDQGISIYRFQLFAWTLVLGVIFCVSVYDGLQMPQFSTTLLGLMGLSSGTYLGFKVPEGKTPGQSAG